MVDKFSNEIRMPLVTSTPRLIKLLDQFDGTNINFSIRGGNWQELIEKKYEIKITNTDDYTIAIPKNTILGLLDNVKTTIMTSIAKLESYANNILDSNDIEQEKKIFDSKKIFVVHGRDEKSRN